MIGVIADLSDRDVVCEFFELFKTPWEFYREDRRYDVVLCVEDNRFSGNAKLVIFYSGKRIRFDGEQKIQAGRQRQEPCILSYEGNRIPIYGDSIGFSHAGKEILIDAYSMECVGYLRLNGESATARIGYNIFAEVRTLLTTGQPSANAQLPALELHIAVLRETIISCGISLVEIPPVPEGYQFIACLTHDVDHPSIRRHRWDRTLFGFLLRAIFGSLFDLIRGRIPVKDLCSNWAAVSKLPFIYTGLAKDFWLEFVGRYQELEEGHRSTFFVVPFGNRPGRKIESAAPGFRATGYGAEDIAGAIRNMLEAGSEVGLHGIDAWLDSSKGCEELEVIRRLTGISEIGVRMHWLYYNEKSPVTLEKAGAVYDSTVGYNETVGYRAGTTQIYKPLVAERLLELPMHAMDTALFYSTYLGLSQRAASARLRQMVNTVAQYGGCLTINWHDRSLFPERLWVSCYRELIQDLKSRGAWFATAGQAISWFRKRRSVDFEENPTYSNLARPKILPSHADGLPGLRIRIYKEQTSSGKHSCKSKNYVDIVLPECTESHTALNVSDDESYEPTRQAKTTLLGPDSSR